ncbi:hypothetical protein cypCar_00035484 [Cyprinus carpio]|nr:hypothetical protein cypCar_00035484 [Cyprinus carpio]
MEATGSGSGAEAEEAQNHTAMLWSIQEAVQRQTLQIGASACGATAVVDVLQALGITVTPETVDHCVRTSLRRNEAPLHDYLHSRSKAVSEEEVHERLCSESVLLVRRQDVLKRLTPDAHLSQISDQHPDPRWRALNVEDQVRQMISEEEHPKTTHLVIPAAYSSGVTFFARRDSDVAQELLSSTDLPLM